jgi:putative FmdB family regulatory protein
MPRYDYRCEDCSHIQEESHPIKGPIECIICEKCHSKKMCKIISAPYVRFIGDWQTNDVRKTN